jgi:hypothetical protein
VTTPLLAAPVASSKVPASLIAAPWMDAAALSVLKAGDCGSPLTMRTEVEPGTNTPA